MPDSTRYPFRAPLRPEFESLETSGIAQIFALGFGRDKLIPLRIGEGHLRLCLASSSARRAEAMDRLVPILS